MYILAVYALPLINDITFYPGGRHQKSITCHRYFYKSNFVERRYSK